MALHMLPYDSSASLRRWRLELIDIRFADLFFNEADSVLAGYAIVGEVWDADPRFRDLHAPTCVLVDSNGDGVAVPSRNCGYGGNGPTASYSLLTALGFPEPAAKLVFSYRVLRLDKHSPEPVIARETRFDGELNAPHHGMRMIDDRQTLLLEHGRDDAVSWRTWTRFAGEWTPHPVELRVYLEGDFATAPSRWSSFHPARANVVVVDASGRQFAALVPSLRQFRDRPPDTIVDFISTHRMELVPTPPAKRGRPAPTTILYRLP